jgi:hypothetical protein
VPERRALVSGGQECVLERPGSDVGVGELVERQPVEFQVVFLAHWVGFGDRDFEPEVEFVVGDAIFAVPVLHDANESGDLGFGAYFFGDLADESLNALARLDVSAGQEPPTFGALAGGES